MDQSAPPLFLWGERLMLVLFGYGDCALRLLPVIAGAAAAVLLYQFARDSATTPRRDSPP